MRLDWMGVGVRVWALSRGLGEGYRRVEQPDLGNIHGFWAKAKFLISSALPCPYLTSTTWCAKDSHAVPVFNYSPADHNQYFCRYELMAHEEPRVESFIDKEVQQSSVYVSFKHANPSLCSPVRSFCAV